VQFVVAEWVALAALIGVLGYVDYATGFETTFFVFYFIPVVFGATRLGLLAGILLSVVSAFVWGAADHLSGHAYSSHMIAVWNTFVRLVAFLTVAWMTARNADLLARERAVSLRLRKAIAEVKVLEGLLPICSSCKRIRDDRGSWQHVEVYVQKRSSATFTHGLCPECAEKWAQDAGLGPVEG
jgi:hypothetical protein